MKIRQFGFALGVALATALAAPAGAQQASQASANASHDLSYAAGSVVVGSLAVIAGAAVLSVSAVETVGDSVVLVLKSASEVATVSVRVAAGVAGAASLAVGSAVKVVSEASGYALYSAGRLIAFIPNALGASLVHHSPVVKAATR